jgi:hypothetical protein
VRRRLHGWLRLISLSLAFASAASGAATLPQQRRPLVRLTLIEPTAEVAAGGQGWQRAIEGAGLALGESLRLGPDAVARLELPWMALTLSAGGRLRFPDGLLLSAVLEKGRVLIESETHDSLKVVTQEAEVRGRGRAIVRRREGATLVTCLSGRFHVASAQGSVTLAPGQGSVALPRRPPSAPGAAPAAPRELWPGRDPVYVARAEPIDLRWKGDPPACQVELLPVGSDVVLIQREVGGEGTRLAIPWHGAFRWRVSACDDRGLEGPPSQEGLIAVE